MSAIPGHLVEALCEAAGLRLTQCRGVSIGLTSACFEGYDLDDEGKPTGFELTKVVDIDWTPAPKPAWTIPPGGSIV